jgi:hypothetical protein
MAKAVVAVPALIVTMVGGQPVNGGEVTISPPGPWLVEGTVQHDNGKPIMAMYYMVDANFPGMMALPPDAEDPTHTTPVDWSFTLGTNEISASQDYNLNVNSLNDDGLASEPVVIHAINFPDPIPIPIPIPTPTPTPPPPPRPVI